jgi:hypothetical protein
MTSPPSERQAKRAAVMESPSEEAFQAVKETLKTEQFQRLVEIHLQVRGAEAFEERRVQDALKLTDEQIAKIRRIRDEATKQAQLLFPRGRPGNIRDVLNKVAALRKATLDRVLALLTADQKKLWEKMIGEPFEIPAAVPIIRSARPKDAGQKQPGI